MAHWVGAQDQVKLAKKTQNTPMDDVIHRKYHTQIKKKFFFQSNLEDLPNL